MEGVWEGKRLKGILMQQEIVQYRILTNIIMTNVVLISSLM